MTGTPALSAAIKMLADDVPASIDVLRDCFDELLEGYAAPEQIGAFLMGLRHVGETEDTLVAGAEAMRQHARRIEIEGPLLDTCGTGGLPWVSLNTSTAVAIVVAAAGGRVAKHGNRSVPPKTGSADVLEALGVNLDIDSATFRACVEHARVGFLFARSHHSAMRHVAPVRASLGIRTIFNLLGPLTNPAGADHQIVGVFDERWVEPMANALHRLGTRRAWVVHGVDGIDEISISGKTIAAEATEDGVRVFEIHPETVGLSLHPITSLRGGTATENAGAIRDLLEGKEGPFRDMVCLNAAAGLVVLGLEQTLAQGLEKAANAIDSGAGLRTLETLVRVSNGDAA